MSVVPGGPRSPPPSISNELHVHSHKGTSEEWPGGVTCDLNAGLSFQQGGGVTRCLLSWLKNDHRAPRHNTDSYREGRWPLQEPASDISNTKKQGQHHVRVHVSTLVWCACPHFHSPFKAQIKCHILWDALLSRHPPFHSNLLMYISIRSLLLIISLLVCLFHIFIICNCLSGLSLMSYEHGP